MMINNGEKKKKLGKLFSSAKMLYAVLGVAAIAVSIVSYSAVSDKVKRSTENALTAYYEQSPVQQNKETQPSEQKTVEKETAAPVTNGSAAVFGNNAETVPTPENENITMAPEAVQPETGFNAESCILPLSASVSKDYSLGYPVFSQTMGDWRTHNGVDIPGYEGDAVQSMSDCTVTAVYQDDLWGGVVETDCRGVTIKYCGLSFNQEVAVGSELAAGDRIGTLSKVPVEVKDGFHIHVEMRENGKLCDPLALLGFAENDTD